MQAEHCVVGLGELLWDLLPEGKQLGGAPANFAYHAQAFGATAAVVSAVGADALGAELKARLQAHRIATRFIGVDPEHPTSTVAVELDQHGHPAYTIHEQVAWDYLDLGPAHLELAKRAAVVCFGSLAQRSSISAAAIRAFLAATAPTALRIFDINLRQHYYTAETILASLDLATVLKLNDEELPVLAGMFALEGDVAAQLQQLLRSFALHLIALTRGANGCTLAVPEQTIECPASPARVVDTVGAGDSFTAALAMGWLAKLSLGQIGQLANRTAAYVCSCSGATPPLPPELTALVTARLG